jgi:hypothetical protein
VYDRSKVFVQEIQFPHRQRFLLLTKTDLQSKQRIKTMKKNILLLVLGVSLVLLFRTGVADYTEDLNTAVMNWNSIYGTNVIITGWRELGIIADEAERQATVAQMTDSTQVYVVAGDPTNPPTITAVLMDGAPQEFIDQWTAVVDSIVAIGQHKIEISWKFVATYDTFKTITVATDDWIKFDAMLATIVIIEPEPTEDTESGGITIEWIWGGTRGQIDWEITCHATPPLCTHDCSAWMTLGEARIECIEEIVGNNCKVHYGWAWRTPTGSIKITWNPATAKFEIEVTGLGSNGMGDGTEIDPCPVPPDGPTFTQWGLIGLMLVFLAIASWVFFWRRRALRDKVT